MSGPTVVATITANDEASARLRAIAKLATMTAKEMERMGRDTGLTRTMNEGAAAADRHVAAVSRLHGAFKQAASAAKEMVSNLGMLAGPMILHAVVKGVSGGAEIQSQDIKNRIAGIPAGEREQAAQLAAELAAKYHNLDTAGLMELYRETRSVLKDTSEVPGMMPVVAQSKSALEASGQSSEGLVYALKGAELLGLAKDTGLFKTYMDSFLKAQEVLGKTISPEQVYEFAKYSKAAGARFSPEFVNTIGPLLSQEMGGSTAGTGLSQFEKMMQTANNHGAAQAFVDIGMASMSDFVLAKNGTIKGLKTGHTLKDADLAASNPAEYVWTKLIPALKAKGFDTADKQLGEISHLYQNQSAQSVVAKLIQQQDTFAAHMVRINAAMGLAATSLERDDAKVAMGTVITGIENLGATLTAPFMSDAAHGLAYLADEIASATLAIHHFGKEYPTAAKAIGGLATAAGLGGGALLSWKLMMGVLGKGGGAAALGGAATALDGSAAALDRAAAALTGAAEKSALTGGKGGLPGTPGGPKGPGQVNSSLLSLSALMAGGWLGYAAYNSPTPLTPEGDASWKSWNDWGDGLMSGILPKGWFKRADGWTAANTGPDMSDYHEQHDRLASGYKQYADSRANPERILTDAIHAEHLNPRLPDYAPRLGHHEAAPEPFTGTQKIDVQVAPVEGKVTGHAELTLHIDASGIKTIQSEVNLSGSLGQSHVVPSGHVGGIGHM